MDFNRLILFGALGMVLMLLWQSWQEYVAEKNPVTQSSSLGQSRSTETLSSPGANLTLFVRVSKSVW